MATGTEIINETHHFERKLNRFLRLEFFPSNSNPKVITARRIAKTEPVISHNSLKYSGIDSAVKFAKLKRSAMKDDWTFLIMMNAISQMQTPIKYFAATFIFHSYLSSHTPPHSAKNLYQ